MNQSSQVVETTLGQLSSALYDHFLQVYGDPELAQVAASTTINDLCFQEGITLTEATTESVEAA